MPIITVSVERPSTKIPIGCFRLKLGNGRKMIIFESLLTTNINTTAGTEVENRLNQLNQNVIKLKLVLQPDTICSSG